MTQPRGIFSGVLFLLLSTVFTVGSLAQDIAQMPKQPTPGSVRVDIPVVIADREQIVAYWTSETGWKSELQLRNNQTSQDLTVTPVLRLADGSETSLSPVTIKPQEVKSVDIDSAIAAANAPQLVGSYGSAVLRYRSGSIASLYAATMIRRTGHPVAFHIDAMPESAEFQIGGREGVWWLPNDTASDYLILTNQGSSTIPADLSFFDASGNKSTQKVTLVPHETKRYSVRKLVQAAHLGGSYGGIKVSAASHAGSLDTVHFLFDETAAFGAILKMFDYDQNSNLEERDYAGTGVWTLRAPMLALANPDPALAFPAGTTLHPRIFVRNTTNKPADVRLQYVWRNDKQTGKVTAPALRLNPYETHLLDVAALQNAGAIPKQANWTSVTLTTNGSPGEVMAVAASYDETLRYGAQTPFSDQLSHRWEGGMWEYDPYHSSIITAGNGGTKPTQAAFAIFYHEGAEKYELEQSLQPDEQMWIDVGKLIREHVPDKNGKMLPPELTMGSYEIQDLTNKGVGTLFEGKVIYDKTYGHVAYGCGGCCGYGLPKFSYDPLGVPFGPGTSSQTVNAPNWCNGGAIEDVTGSFSNNWSTANTSIATVDGYGLHSGMSVGTTSSLTSGQLEGNSMRLCPIRTFRPTGNDNVNPTVTFGNTPLVPLGKPVSTTATVNPSTNTTPITLTISTTSGTGSATFGNGYTTMTITTTTSVTLIGVTASSTSNNMQVTATVNNVNVGSTTFTVTGTINGAIPVNFRMTSFSVQPSATLYFTFTWDSSSGNKADLSTCNVEEYVTFVGSSPNYYWPTPPYAPSYTPNPFLGSTPISASSIGMQDTHGHPGFLAPYSFKVVAADQKYQFQCPYYQNNQWVQLMPLSGTLSITRVINLTNGAPPWTYQITKTGGYVASMNLP